MNIEHHDFFVINDFNYTYKNHVIKMYPRFHDNDGLSISAYFDFYIASFAQILEQDYLRDETDEKKIQTRLKRNFATYYSSRCINGNLNPNQWYIVGINAIGESKVTANNFNQGLDKIKKQIDKVVGDSKPVIPYLYWHMYLCSLMNEHKANILSQESFYRLNLDYQNKDNPKGRKTFEQYLQKGIENGWFINVDNEKAQAQVTENFFQLFWKNIILLEKNLDIYYLDDTVL
jgi:hypothetical protein